MKMKDKASDALITFIFNKFNIMYSGSDLSHQETETFFPSWHGIFILQTSLLTCISGLMSLSNFCPVMHLIIIHSIEIVHTPWINKNH